LCLFFGYVEDRAAEVGYTVAGAEHTAVVAGMVEVAGHTAAAA